MRKPERMKSRRPPSSTRRSVTCAATWACVLISPGMARQPCAEIVSSTRDVEFSYLVQGIRKHYKGHEPIQPNTLFVPTGFSARMEPYPAHVQKRLVDLRIYNSDGSVNLATAERMGWAQTWREEEEARQAAAAAKATREQGTGPEGPGR